jgi:sugar/nucleoside kinase (ribokinase family)
LSVTVIGDAFVDLIVPIQGIKRGETYHRKILVSCGGTANVAVQISKLGESAKFLGKVGNDILGKYFKQNLRDNGVKDLTVVDQRNPTGICVSLIYEDGERTMIADRGANDFLSKEDVLAYIDEIVDSKIVYFSGYSLLSEVSSEAVLYLIKECYRKCDVYFNPGAPNLINRMFFRKVIHDFVDILILNEEEAKALSGKVDLKDALSVLNDMVDLAVVTRGRKGCVVLKAGDVFHVKSEQIDAFDTTGAGDAFAAGFIVGKLRGFDHVECAMLGNKTAMAFLKEKTEVFK